MSGFWYRFRAELRARWRAWVAVGAVAGVAGAVVVATFAGARRTDEAYDRFLASHAAYDVAVLNYPEDGTAVFDFDELGSLPIVADSAEAAVEYLSFDALNVISSDSRIGTEVNRAEVVAGRRADPDDPTEAVVAFTLAEDEDLDVGDTFSVLPEEIVAAVESGADAAELAEAFELDDDSVAQVEAILRVVPGAELTIVGIVASPGDFPPQFQHNRPLVHLTPAFARVWEDTTHRVLYVRLVDGERSVPAFVSELEARSGGLPAEILVQSEHAGAAKRSLHFQALALRLLAGLTALTSALILAQLMVRVAQVESGDQRTLRTVGLVQRQRFGLGLLRGVVMAVVAAVVTVVGATLGSAAFPTGLARRAEIDPGIQLDRLIVPLGALAVALVVVALDAWPSWQATRPETVDGRAPRTSFGARWPGLRGGVASVATGLRMAVEPGQGARALPLRAGLVVVVIGVAAPVAALTFGASLSDLVDTPRRYGVTWDLELVSFDEDSEATAVAVLQALRSDPRVAGVAAGSASFTNPVEVDGHRSSALAFTSLEGGLGLPILDGRAPRGAEEIVLGPRTLQATGRGLGDEVDVALGDRHRVVMVVGTAVFPTVSEQAQLGRGVWMSNDLAAALTDDEVSFGALFSVVPGADPDAVAADVAEAVGSEVTPVPPGTPADILNFGRVEALPVVAAIVQAAIAIGVLVHLLFVTVRRRRGELAVLKALGLTPRDLRAVVGVQATATVVVGLVVGVPLGVAFGSWTWNVLAEDLGVLSDPSVPVALLAGLSVAAVLGALLLSLLPSRSLSRVRVADELRAP